MKPPIPLFRYRPGTTPVHRIPAGIKLFIYILFSLAVFASPVSLLTGVSVFLCIICVTARISVQSLLANIRLLFWYTLIICVFRFSGQPLDSAVLLRQLGETLLYVWRLALVLFAGTLFYETTSSLEIRYALSRIQTRFENIFGKPFRFIFPSRCKTPLFPDIAFLLSLTITFIPRIFDSWTLLNQAWDARGGNLQKGIMGAWHRFTVLIPLLFIKLFSVAADTDRAIRNRSK